MEFLQTLLVAIITAATPIIVTFICTWLKSLYEKNKTYIQNETAQRVLGQVTDMIVAAVETTTSTYVKQLKNDNLFDKDAQKQAFQLTYDTVKKQLTNESSAIIEQAYGDVEEYLKNKIEQLVEEMKK